MKKIPPFLTGSTFANLITVFGENHIDWKFLPRTLHIFALSLIGTPFSLVEALLFRKKIADTNVKPPVFILGHWRSGTTYLHYLLSRDSSFYAPSNFDVFVPGLNILGKGITKAIISVRMPKTRPMDNVELHPDFPQEEEFAIANSSPYSVYHALAFPSKMEKYFCRYVLMKLASPENWRKCYHTFIQKMQYKAGEKTLLLKNPVNTGRVRELVNMYPDAKFIYLHRNPAEVKISTYRMLSALIEANTLQHLDDQKLRDAVEMFHSRLLASYEEQKDLIPDGNLVEIMYEDFVASPVEVVKKVYDDLNLKGFANSHKKFEDFAKAQKNFVRQRYAQEPVTA